MTKFWCCEKLERSDIAKKDCYIKPDDPSYREYPGTWSVYGMYDSEQIKYCPFCGRKLL